MPKKSQKKRNIWQPIDLTLEYVGVGQGICLYTCFAKNNTGPLGTVWIRSTSLRLNSCKNWLACVEIEDIYVQKRYRRMGIATYMYQTLLDLYGILKTADGTKEGGMATLKANKFKRIKETGEFILIKKSKLRKV